MAGEKAPKGRRHANPMMTRTGKVRLGPLSLKQLEEILEKSSKPKEQGKIRNRIRTLKKILSVDKFRLVESFK
jgi:hypothetical protein